MTYIENHSMFQRAEKLYVIVFFLIFIILEENFVSLIIGYPNGRRRK